MNDKPSVMIIRKPERLSNPVTNVTKDRKVVNFYEAKRKLEKKKREVK